MLIETQLSASCRNGFWDYGKVETRWQSTARASPVSETGLGGEDGEEKNVIAEWTGLDGPGLGNSVLLANTDHAGRVRRKLSKERSVTWQQWNEGDQHRKGHGRWKDDAQGQG